jgi:hypothetical protein
MTIKRVFNGAISPNSYGISDLIEDALSIYIVNPDSTNEVNLDLFLQLEINIFENRQIRLSDGITEINTETLINIPNEYSYCELNKRIAIYSSFTVNIEVYCIYQEFSIDTSLLNTIKGKIDNLTTSQNINNLATAGIVVNQISQNVALGVLGASLAPYTLGASLGVEPPLLAGTAALLLP